jgi:streptomycin 6-kinase
MSSGPGELIGRGRSADVFGLAHDRVLRRYRDGHDAASEADAMQYLSSQGYPAPEVYDVSGPDIVMARLDGATMLHTLGGQPWRIGEMASLLAALQRRLHAIAPHASMPTRFGEREGVLHLDFHPDNVMLTSTGPMVIDFSSVSAGPSGADVAQSWIIMATSTIPGSPFGRLTGAIGRHRLIRAYLRASDVVGARAWMARVGEDRRLDVHTTEIERERIDRLVARTTLAG